LVLNETSTFYELVTQGENPEGALEAALKLQAEQAL
jgi:hypothetical protein